MSLFDTSLEHIAVTLYCASERLYYGSTMHLVHLHTQQHKTEFAAVPFARLFNDTIGPRTEEQGACGFLES